MHNLATYTVRIHACMYTGRFMKESSTDVYTSVLTCMPAFIQCVYYKLTFQYSFEL